MSISYSDAMAMRDLIRDEAQDIIHNARPNPRYAEVVTIVPADRRCLVLFPGDSTPVSVSYGSVRPTAAGQYVRIDGSPTQPFISDVMGDTDTQTTLTALGQTVVNLDAAAVKKTTDQTIAGIKTFSSIPVLPASNPTTANQAARKQYVDDAITADNTTNKILINEFWPSASPSINHAADVAIIFNTVGAAEGGCALAANPSANINCSKTGWWRLEARMKFAYFNSTAIKLGWIEVAGGRVAFNDSATPDGWLTFGSTVYITSGQLIQLKAFQFTGAVRLIDPGFNACCITCTWLRP